jgi:RHS repeat-associated protein
LGADVTGKSLYNGNISNALYGIAQIDNSLSRGYSYAYDQLNRIKAMNAHNGLPTTSAGGQWSNSTIIQDHAESYSYDPNGNIYSLVRNGTISGSRPLAMDNLSYSYYYYNNTNVRNTYNPVQPLPTDAWNLTNQLAHVKDAVPAVNYPIAAFPNEKDIDNQTDNNYTYDGIGNLVKDNAENITKISWTVYGKIRSIDKTDGTRITYDYDAGGNRIEKEVITPAQGANAAAKTITYYLRDAQGNTISVYSWSGAPAAVPVAAGTGLGVTGQKWDEQQLYGSSRLGMWRPNIVVPATLNLTNDAVQVGSKLYELTNHLGNVLATISDNRIGVPVAGNPNIVDYYKAELINANDYTPFGMQMAGRVFSGSGYRYGFNGKENDNEVKGLGNQQDYGMRIYDPRLGKFLSVDPLTKSYPELTPYQFASNSPIQAIDLDGLEAALVTTRFATQKNALVKILNSKAIVDYSKPLSYSENLEIDGKTYEMNSTETLNGRDIRGRGMGFFSGIKKITSDDVSGILGYSDFVFQVVYQGSLKEQAVLHESNAGPLTNSTNLLDFKNVLYKIFDFNSNSLIDIDGVAYNANEAGNFIWGMVLTEAGIMLNPKTIAELGTRNRNDEPHEQKALEAGIKKAESLKGVSKEIRSNIFRNYSEEYYEYKRNDEETDKYTPSNLLGLFKDYRERK